MKTERRYSQEQVVTPLPELNVPAAKVAREDAREYVLSLGKAVPPYTSSLELAIALSLYNARSIKNGIFHRGRKSKLERQVISGFKHLANLEIDTAQEENPLPTIGIEIETPKKPFELDMRKKFERYGEFFDVIGMPRNKINRNHKLYSTCWEFSPNPSFSASVQARIISELIQGGFLPHLTRSQNPQDIQRYLDPNLVSLHINIGIPENLESFVPRDSSVLAEALAAAYTSAQRLEHRKSKKLDFAIQKPGTTTIPEKGSFFETNRIELKAMEILGPDTYRALITTQALFGLLFDAKAGYLQSRIELEQLLQSIHETFIAYNHRRLNNITDGEINNHALARLAARPNASNAMKIILEDHAKAFRKKLKENTTPDVINSGGPQPPQEG